MASEKVLRINPRDNVLVALTPLPAGEPISFAGEQFVPLSEIPAKQKIAVRDLAVGDEVIMYGGIVGLVRQAIPRGGLLSTRNVQHDASGFGPKVGNYSWSAPDVSAWSSRTFDGYHRADGSVGTRNYWLIIPLVFCENQNVKTIQEAFEKELGYQYKADDIVDREVKGLVKLYREGKSKAEITGIDIEEVAAQVKKPEPLFSNIDGIKFLNHTLGCGGTR